VVFKYRINPLVADTPVGREVDNDGDGDDDVAISDIKTTGGGEDEGHALEADPVPCVASSIALTV